MATGNKKYLYTKHPEYLTFGMKITELEQVKYFPDGIKVIRSDNQAMSGQGKVEWSTVGDRFPLVLAILKKSTKMITTS